MKFYRNDLYITIEKGEFERGGKSTGKNIEVTVLVLDEEGQLIDVSYKVVCNPKITSIFN